MVDIIACTYYMLSIDLPSVGNLTAEQCSTCILIEWETPYLLPGLSVSYMVFIDEERIQDNISGINHTSYCPAELTNATYNVTVKAFNGSIIGDTAVELATFEVCK